MTQMHITWDKENPEPKSLENARQWRTDLQNDIDVIRAQLAQPQGEMSSGGRVLEGEEYRRWRGKAQLAIAYKKSYIRLIDDWIMQRGENIWRKALIALARDILEGEEEIYDDDTTLELADRYMEKVK